MRASAPPVSLAEAQGLLAVLDGTRPREPAHFEQLVTFGRTMYRLGLVSGSGAPACNLGDVLTALAAVAQPGEETFTFDPAVDVQAFARLGFREASLGIARTQRENSDGWWAHAQKNRAFVEEAARKTRDKTLAVVLGAGHAFDLPLVELARQFQKLVLLDIDAQALEATVAGVFKDPALRARVEIRAMDFTGINGALVQRFETLLNGPGTAAEISDGLERLCQGYRLAAPPRLLPQDEQPSLLVSSCVLSQVAWPQRVYAERLFERRFGPVRGMAEQRWARHFSELELRVQQDHLTALVGVAEVVALTSDVVSHVTALDDAGSERTTGRTIHALGVPSLLELIPRMFQTDGHQSWLWYRYRATRRGSGSCMSVEGVRLGDAQTTTGIPAP